MTDPVSHFDAELAGEIENYLESKPITKRSITAVEVTTKVGGTSRTAPDTLHYMSRQPGSVIGDRLIQGEGARWSVTR